jgi:hypothetical protein
LIISEMGQRLHPETGTMKQRITAKVTSSLEGSGVNSLAPLSVIAQMFWLGLDNVKSELAPLG